MDGARHLSGEILEIICKDIKAAKEKDYKREVQHLEKTKPEEMVGLHQQRIGT